MFEEFRKDFVEILICNDVTLSIDIDGKDNDESLIKLPSEQIIDNGEEHIQLMEGYLYHYEFSDRSYSLGAVSKIVKPHRRTPSRGTITTGIYVGHLSLHVLKDGKAFCSVGLEVRSRKADYRSEYQIMLKDIAEECIELLMIHSSPVTQRFTVDHNIDSKTIYQRFAFVKSMVDSTEFRNAIHRVISMPVTSWKQKTEERDIRRSGRITGSTIRQIVSKSDRIPLPSGHPLYSSGLSSVPSRLTITTKVDSVDTPENRFVKHAIREFKRFCVYVVSVIEEKGNKPAILTEAVELEERLGSYLNHSVFKEVLNPVSLPLNSPILQRKEGYREILRVWLMYDLAAKLTWDALDKDDYHTGKRDVATLYEYWLFFKLLKSIKKIFKLEDKETKQLIISTKDTLGLQLRSGKCVALEGEYIHSTRPLKIKYWYNRTFGHSDYPQSGSWTQQMRPDYTLSIWPSEFEEEDAEAQELIVHIHFDAKYKVVGLKNIINNYNSLDDEKTQEKEGKYKRSDLLKMHAYKDAIRRTVGAYVLYPGSEIYKEQGFHEIIPGLGAFPVSPSNNGDGMANVETFIKSIIDHICNRATRREELSYHRYDINNSDKRSDLTLYEKLPEKYGGLRVTPIAKKTVLVGYMQLKQTEWIDDNNLYNIRFDIPITPEIIGAGYLLLYSDSHNFQSNKFYKITGYPEIWSKETLINSHYPDPSQQEYFIYKLENNDLKDLDQKFFSIEKLQKHSKYDVYRPFSVTLPELLKSII